MRVSPTSDVIRQWVLIAAGVVGLFAASGCSTDAPDGCTGSLCVEETDTGGGEGCEQHSDCPIGEQCVSGQCQPATGCKRDGDCPGDEVCISGQCYPQEEDTGVADTGAVDVGDTGGTSDVETTDGGELADGSCQGCMLQNDAGMNQCIEGEDREACGSGGEVCKQCGEYEECKDGSCQPKPCSPQNCDGCCLNGECKDGTSSMACGKDGEACSQCQGETRCTSARQCESCNGCWTDTDECKSGDTSAFCGSGGVACQSCGPDEKCEGGRCIEKSCSETCSGCCDGSKCLSGNRDGACGTGGESCKECGDGYECDFARRCDLDRDSRWDAIAVDGEVPRSDQNGIFYDHRGNPPDPYIEVKVDGFSGTTTGRSDKVSDDTSPFWYDTTAKDVRAADLKRNNNTTFTLKDADPWYAGSDDKIASCKGNFEDKHFTGTVEFKCSQPVDVKYKFKLEYHP